jgi:hypothetical protein
MYKKKVITGILIIIILVFSGISFILNSWEYFVWGLLPAFLCGIYYFLELGRMEKEKLYTKKE